jgi:hypothetical protein
MTTLNESINAKIAELEASAAAIKSKAEVDLAAVQSQIDEAKGHLTGLAAWLQHDFNAVKEELVRVLGWL